MVETPDAVAALPEMLKVDGVGGVLIGPSDLALSHGMAVAAQHGDDAYDALLRSIIEPCRAADTPVVRMDARSADTGLKTLVTLVEHALSRATAAVG
jgi:4-hydroxy-2-oxoheptanedioate aldolase